MALVTTSVTLVPSSVLLFLVVRPGAPSSVLAPFVAMPFAPSSNLYTPQLVFSLFVKISVERVTPNQLKWSVVTTCHDCAILLFALRRLRITRQKLP